jgi:hypothetical protein
MTLAMIRENAKVMAVYVLSSIVWFSFAHGYGVGFLLDAITFLSGLAVWVLSSWVYFKYNPLAGWDTA